MLARTKALKDFIIFSSKQNESFTRNVNKPERLDSLFIKHISQGILTSLDGLLGLLESEQIKTIHGDDKHHLATAAQFTSRHYPYFSI